MIRFQGPHEDDSEDYTTPQPMKRSAMITPSDHVQDSITEQLCWRHDPYRPNVLTATPPPSRPLLNDGAVNCDEWRICNGSILSSEAASVDHWGDSLVEANGSPWESDAEDEAPAKVAIKWHRGGGVGAVSETPIEIHRPFPLPKPRSRQAQSDATTRHTADGPHHGDSVVTVHIKSQFTASVFCPRGHDDEALLLRGVVVVFEGDRGEEMGVVKSVRAVRYADARMLSHMPRFIRIATSEEGSMLQQLREVEDVTVLTRLKALAKEVRFPVGTLEDAAMQADRQRLTIYLNRRSKQMLDFRKLQRVAFREFHCRIWFVYVDELS